MVKLKNCTVKWFTDNQNVAHILQVGSKTPLLQKEALCVFSLCVAHNVSIEPEWIPRSENQVADFISHIQDWDDWQLNPRVFYSLQVRWGPCTIDRFASYYNTQLPRFNSRYYNPGTEAVDAFTCDWSSEINWWCPPVCLIPRVLRHAQNCCCRGILVVPHWPSAPFWPLICPTGESFAPYVCDWCDLPLSEHLFLNGRCSSGFFSSYMRVLAMLLDFHVTVSPPLLFQ